MNRKSQNLELVSEPKPIPLKSLERRRFPRLSLTSEQFRSDINGKVFSVADLSLEGMALHILDSQDLQIFPVAAPVVGTLKIRNEKISVFARVVNLTPLRVGCQFENLDPSTLATLKKFLDPSTLGESLRPIPSSEVGVLWYHGHSGTDLLLWRSMDGQFYRFAIFLLGSFTQWDQQKGLSTGFANLSGERGEEWGMVRFETLLMEADTLPDPQKLSIAKALLLSSNLPQNLKSLGLRQLELGQA